MNSFTEENYLKAIYKLCRTNEHGATTNAVAEEMDTKASSVTDMLKKLAAKKLINYKKYQGVSLTENGRLTAIGIIRKHRLWEVFLVNNLGFSWDRVHEIAEQLEHIHSDELIQKLDEYLDFPKYDPHGDPIPDKDGNILHHKDMCLGNLKEGENGLVVGVKDTSPEFLQYLERSKLMLGSLVNIEEVISFDNSMNIKVGKVKISVSETVAKNLYIKRQ